MNKNDIKYGIPNEQWDIILDTLKSNEKISKIVLFGSRAKGNYKISSDIDIAIVTDGNLTFTELNKLKVNLDDLMLPYSVDLVEYNKIENADLIDHINRVGINLCQCYQKK